MRRASCAAMEETKERPRIRVSDPARRYVAENSWEFMVGLCAALAGPLFFLFPELLDASALGMVLPRIVERFWAVAFTAAGWLILVGMVGRDARFEVAGLLGMVGIYICEVYAAVAARGGAGIVIFALLLGPGLGALARVYVLRYEPEVAPWRRRRF